MSDVFSSAGRPAGLLVVEKAI